MAIVLGTVLEVERASVEKRPSSVCSKSDTVDGIQPIEANA